jgi:hypothetical protein
MLSTLYGETWLPLNPAIIENRLRKAQKSTAMEAEYRSVHNELNTSYNVDEQSFEEIITAMLKTLEAC